MEQNNTIPNRKRALFLILLLVATISLSFNTACLSTDSNFNVSNTNMSVDYSSYLGYTAEITGTLKNNSHKNYRYVQIEFSVYNSSGIKLGTAYANATSIGAGESWNFTAMLLDFPTSKPTHYKLVDITAY